MNGVLQASASSSIICTAQTLPPRVVQCGSRKQCVSGTCVVGAHKLELLFLHYCDGASFSSWEPWCSPDAENSRSLDGTAVWVPSEQSLGEKGRG